MYLYQKVDPTWTGLVLSAVAWAVLIACKLLGVTDASWWLINLPAYWPFAFLAVFTVFLAFSWVVFTAWDVIESCLRDAWAWLTEE